MRISKASSAALVISIVALIFAVWPLVSAAKGESITPYINYNFETRELSLEERVMELQCWMASLHQKQFSGGVMPKSRKQMECLDLDVSLLGDGRVGGD